MANAVTELLSRVNEGDRTAIDLLMPPIYDHLRAMAQSMMNDERPDHTLSATALVNEAYLKLVGHQQAPSQDRAQFLALAGHAMRQILVDHARHRNRIKRGGNCDRLLLDLSLLGTGDSSWIVDVEALVSAHTRLGNIRPRAEQVVDMRFFAGMTFEQIAGVIETSVSTAEREWRYARAWLGRALAASMNIDGFVSEPDHRTTRG